MPYSTALNRAVNRPSFSLKAAGAETASTAGTWVDLGDVPAGEIDVAVTAVAGTTPTLLVDLYGSPSGTSRAVTDGVTFNTSTSVGGATALFTAADVGANIAGAGIPLADYIASVIVAVPAATVTNKALTTNVATLTTSAAHGISVGQVVVVAGVDATFNGTYVATAGTTGSTLTYADTASNVSSTAATGTATGISTAVLGTAATVTASTVTLTISQGFKIGTIGATAYVDSGGADPTTIAAVGTFRAVFALPRYVQYRSRITGSAGQSFTYSVTLDSSW